MQRFYFDVQDHALTRDEEGVELPDVNAVRGAVMRALPYIAAHEIADGGDHQQFTMLVRNADGRNIYSATLTYAGGPLPR